MAVPDFQTVMLPFLRTLESGSELHFREIVDSICNAMHLTEQDRSERIPSGLATLVDNRIGWARTYLKKAGLIESPKRAYYHITRRGLELLRENPSRVDIKLLSRFPEFVAFRELRHPDAAKIDPTPEAAGVTPEEALESAYGGLRVNLEAELLDRVKEASPSFFERLVVELLVSMGYGGSLHDAGQAVGKSGDGGIDGIIKEDRLGLDIIYIQAKRWEASVGRPEVQKFAGALQGHRARKGVMITTSSLTKDAVEFARGIDSKLILIDGPTLTGLMIDHNVGVSPVRHYEVKKIDSDYFAED